jgi:transcriptional regulator with XRE-family HTH domain
LIFTRLSWGVRAAKADDFEGRPTRPSFPGYENSFFGENQVDIFSQVKLASSPDRNCREERNACRRQRGATMVKPQLQKAASAPPNAVGERLKHIRQETGLTLAEVGQRTGVSISNLSKIERGEVSPSFDVVIRLCEGLDIPLEQFVTPGPKLNVSGRKTQTLRGQAVPFSTEQYDYLAHSSEISRKSMIPLEMWVTARSADAFEHWSEHDGEEFVYVISGEIEIHTDQYAPFRIGAGESAYFDSAMKHIYICTSVENAHILSISYNPHVSAPAPVERFMHPAAKPGRGGA